MADKDDTASPSPPRTEVARSAQRDNGDAGAQSGTRTIVVERRRGFFARWMGRLAALLLIIGILILIAFVGVTLLLRSDVPRSVAEGVATRAMGLDLSMSGLDVGWDGDITIHDLVVRLPSIGDSEGEKLLEVPHIKARIEPLPRVALGYLRGQRPDVKRLEIDSPTAYATQDDSGEWNIAQAIGLITGSRPAAPQTDAPGGPQMPPLPEIALTNGAIIVKDKQGQVAQLSGFELHGKRDNPLVYRINGGSPERLDLAGELFPASGRRQQFTIDLAGINPELRAMFGLPQATLLARWDGGLTADGVEGVVAIESASVNQTQIAGKLQVVSAGGVTEIMPVPLKVRGVPVAGELDVPEGRITIADQVRAERLLVNTMQGQVLVRSASFDPASFDAVIDLAFKDLRAREGDSLTGELLATAGYDAFGEPTARAEFRSSGNFGDTSFARLDAEIVADGPVYHDWGTLDIQVTLKDSPLLIRPPEAPTTLPEAEARIEVRLNDPDQPRIELANLRSLNPDIMELRGWGVYFTAASGDYEAGEYLASFEQRGLPVKLPRVEEKVPLYLGFDLKGRYYRDPDPAKTVIAPVQITRLYGELAEVELEGFGQYVILADGEAPDPPLALTLTLTREARIPAPVIPAATDIIGARARLQQPAATQEAAAPGEFSERETIQIEPIRGKIESWLEIAGDPRKVEFHGSGGVLTSSFAIGAMELGTIRTDIELTLTRDYLTVYTPANEDITDLQWQYAQLFGARIDFEAEIPFKPDQPGHIALDIAEMDVGLASQALGLPPGVTGSIDGKLDIDLTGLSPQQAVARGWFVVDELTLPQAQIAQRIVIGIPPRQEGDDPRGGVLLAEGMFNIPVELQQLAELAPGPTLFGEERALSFNFSYDLRQPRQLQLLNLKSDRYPVVLPPRQDGGRYIDTELSLATPAIFVEFNQGLPQVRGNVTGAMQVWTGTEPFNVGLLADGEIELEATRDRVDLEDLFIDLPDIGVITGGGMLDLTDLPARSRIYLHAQALNLEALAWRLGLAEGATGLADFSFSIQPGPGDHPQGEVLVNFAFAGDHARWRTVSFEQGQVMAYLSRVPLPDDSPSRGQFDFTLITTERIHLQVADGTIDGYFKLRNRGRTEDADPSVFSPFAGFGDDWYVNGTMDARGLALGQLARLIDQDNVAGRLNVSAIAYGNLNQKPPPGSEENLPRFPLSGEGALAIDQGELRNFNLFQRILDLVNQLTRLPRRDSLEARFRVETGHLYVDSLEAYIDGTEIRMAGRLYNVLDPGVTTMQASGVVMLRPLSQIPLPFFREADDIFGVIQTNATAFRAHGLFKDPTVEPALWSEIGETLRVLLVPTLKRQ